MYLSGANNRVIHKELQDGVLGLLITPQTQYRVDQVAVWAMDNGCFTNCYPGDEKYLATLDRYAEHQQRCLFVAAPDVVGDAEATLQLFKPMAKLLRERGWPVALVAQDGMIEADIPWHLINWLFIGGTTEWKLGEQAEALIKAAKARGLSVHVGRVNSAKRFRRFASMGCDTADGTFLAFAPEINAPRLKGWIKQSTQHMLFRRGHAYT